MLFAERKKLGPALLKALGIDPTGVKSLHIQCDTHSAPLITIQRLIKDPETHVLETVLDSFEIVPKD